MEKKWNGHRVFCGCDADYETVGASHQFIDDGSEFDTICPSCDNYFWYYEDKSQEPPRRLTFTIDHPGEPAAGLSSFTDTVTVEVESGNPGGEEGEFAECMAQCLREWYDGAKVDRRKE